jgi:hypothetical protein
MPNRKRRRNKVKVKKPRGENRYNAVLTEIFRRHYNSDGTTTAFKRKEMVSVGEELGIEVVDNKGDAVYSLRYRTALPAEILKAAPAGHEWVIAPAGKGLYRFELVKGSAWIIPRSNSAVIKIPDATPEIIRKYARSEEQALLAIMRYNRLIDTFLGITAYSLQNHLRSFVNNKGQMEIDEIYVGLNRAGEHFIVPVQAKGGNDFLSVVQSSQDIAWCAQELPQLTCRSVSAQFAAGDVIALFETTVQGGVVKVVDERHYKLVPGKEIVDTELITYRTNGSR